MWSLIGDLAWAAGARTLADLAYSHAYKTLERRHLRQSCYNARIITCNQPDCHWMHIGSLDDAPDHECPQPPLEIEW